MGASTKAIPQPIRQQIADRKAEGKSTASTAKEFGVSEHLVRSIAAAAEANGGIAPAAKQRGRPTDHDTLDEIARLWLAGLSTRNIAEAVGRQANVVYVAVKKMKADGTLPKTQPIPAADTPTPRVRYRKGRRRPTVKRTKPATGTAFRPAPVELPPPACFRCGKRKGAVVGLYCHACERVYAALSRRLRLGAKKSHLSRVEEMGVSLRA